ncbi:hypothetical protein ACTXG7_11505 [Mycolicibacterium sp. Dal123E01]|uniref:hypothetical protein n=1 Tax=Mycolicibacterium sp. Dal123E01 TaxID=3457578 RepID=UPI00403E886A
MTESDDPMSEAERLVGIAAALTSGIITLVMSVDAQLALLATLLRAVAVTDGGDVLLDDFARRCDDLRELVGPACTEVTMRIGRR